MSVSNPARCLFSRSNGLLRPVRRDLRPFHSTSAVCARRRPRYNSVRADDLQVMEDISRNKTSLASVDKNTLKRIQRHTGITTFRDTTSQELQELNNAAAAKPTKYSEEQMKAAQLYYNDAQMDAIREADSIDERDFLTQARKRSDPGQIKYTDDDFTNMDYLYDRRQQNSNTGWMLKRTENITMKNEEELYAKLAEFIKVTGDKYIRNGQFNPSELQDETDPKGEGILEQMEVEFEKFAMNPRTLFNAPNEETYKLLDDKSRHVQAAELPKLTDPLSEASATEQGEEDENPAMVRLQKRMGWDLDAISRIRTRSLVYRRVSNQTRMGKVASQYFLVIAGNENGLIGIGEGKSTEPAEAAQQAVIRAIRNMKPIARYEQRTIFGEVKAKVGATEVVLTAKHPGFGNRGMHLIFEIARAAGIKDLHARVPAARNKMNIVKATVEALHSQRLPEDIARGRGRKLVDVRKVYYGGKTL